MGRRRRSHLAVALLLVAGLAALLAALLAVPRGSPSLPPLSGLLVYVSDKDGRPLLYARDLATGSERRLTALSEGTTDPAPSPDGRWVAFSSQGRLGRVELASGRVDMLTLGNEYADSQPSWHPDGDRLVVVSRPNPQTPGDLHLLVPGANAADVTRDPLTRTPGQSERFPVVASDGRSVAFLRDEQIFSIDVAARRERRLTSGFRRRGAPRRLGQGELIFPFSDDKEQGIERLALDADSPRTLISGTARYAVVAPLGDGRHLVAEFLYDTGTPMADVLRLGSGGELRLLGIDGTYRGTLARSWRHGYSSPVVVHR